MSEILVGSVEPSSSSKFFGFCSKFDIFSFLPVPIGREVSTKRSIIGSLILLIFFLFYVSYGIYKFAVNNPPRTNQYWMPINDALEIDSPSFAISYMTGENLNISFYNESYFKFKLQEVTIYKDLSIPRKYLDVPFIECSSNNIPWIKKNSNFTNLKCPDRSFSDLHMQGLIYSSDVHQYPRVQIVLCNTTNSSAQCAEKEEIEGILSKGRLFFFIAKPGSTNFATEKRSPEEFTLLYYFMVPGFYNRAELAIRKNNYKVKPDYLTRFYTQEYSTLTQVSEKIYMSKTPDPTLLFLIWLRLDQNEEFNDIVFFTLIDNISLWGALWGVLFSMFAFYFLKHNRKRFYERKPEWVEFDEEYERMKRRSLEEDEVINKRKKEEEEEEEEKKSDQAEDRKLI